MEQIPMRKFKQGLTNPKKASPYEPKELHLERFRDFPKARLPKWRMKARF
jgi:hypothetical protein